MAFLDEMKVKIQNQKDRAARLKAQAQKRIPEAYHDFLLDLEQRVKLGNFDARDELKAIPGVVSFDGKTYIEITLPYVGVDGRVQMAIDEHRKAGKKLQVSFETEWVRAARALASGGTATPESLKLIPEGLKDVLTARVESEIYGTFEGTAKIGWGGSGVDRTNPYENAQTSALGRALGNMGYGLLGGGIASYEEVKAARAEQETIEKRGAPAPSPKPAPTPRPAVTANNANPDGNLQPPPQPLSPEEAEKAAVMKPDFARPAEPTASGDDPSLEQEVGPCVDCGKDLEKPFQSFVKNQRKKGSKTRWAHKSVPGGESKCKKTEA